MVLILGFHWSFLPFQSLEVVRVSESGPILCAAFDIFPDNLN